MAMFYVSFRFQNAQNQVAEMRHKLVHETLFFGCTQILELRIFHDHAQVRTVQKCQPSGFHFPAVMDCEHGVHNLLVLETKILSLKIKQSDGLL